MGRLFWIEFGRKRELTVPSWLTIGADGTLGIHPERVSWAWHVMLPWMMGKGVKERDARKVIGQIAKHVPRNLVIGWCEGIVKADPVDVVPYVEKALAVYKDQKDAPERRRDDPQAQLDIDLGHEAWVREMKRLDPNWAPPQLSGDEARRQLSAMLQR